MPKFIVHQERCKQCGICAQVCPAKILKGAEGALPFQRPNTEDRCIACGHCTAFCPHRACDIDVLPAGEYRPVQRDLLPSAEAVAMLCQSRRSTRQYKQDPVSRELLAGVLDTVRYAPTAKNQQELRFLCLGRSSLNTLGDCLTAWLEDPGTTRHIPEAKGLAQAWKAGADPIFRGAPHLVCVIGPRGNHWAAADAAIAASYLELAALPHKLGCCWAGYAMSGIEMHRPARAYLGLGDDEAVHAAQMIGFMRLRPLGIPARKPLQCDWRE